MSHLSGYVVLSLHIFYRKIGAIRSDILSPGCMIGERGKSDGLPSSIVFLLVINIFGGESLQDNGNLCSVANSVPRVGYSLLLLAS